MTQSCVSDGSCVPILCSVIALSLCVTIVECGVAAQPESLKTVAAFDVPIHSEAERDEFVEVLRAAAKEEVGLQVDATSLEELASLAKVDPNTARTVSAGVWRGSNDQEPIADAMDWPDHPGEVWITFARGQDIALSNRFREHLMRRIQQRWPGTLPLPIIESRSIPLFRDLVKTPTGYVLNPTAAARYAHPQEDRRQAR